MSVAPNVPCIVTRQEIADLVRNYIRQGMTEHQAGLQIIADMRGLGLQEALLDALGSAAVVQVWRDLAANMPRPQVIKPAAQPSAPSKRRVDVDQLKKDTSLLEGMYQIGGTYRRIGDMDKALCRVAAQQFKAAAMESAHTARYFHELARALNGGETVRQRFDNDSLMRLWDVAGRDG